MFEKRCPDPQTRCSLWNWPPVAGEFSGSRQIVFLQQRIQVLVDMYRRVIPICLGRSIDRQDGEDFKICVSGHFQIWAAVEELQTTYTRLNPFLKREKWDKEFSSWILKQDLQKHTTPTWSVSLANGTEWHGQCIVLCDLWKEDSTFGGLFLCQVLILYTVIVVSIYNLTVKSENSTLWTALLSSCLGYLLPNPTIKTKHVLPDSA